MNLFFKKISAYVRNKYYGLSTKIKIRRTAAQKIYEADNFLSMLYEGKNSPDLVTLQFTDGFKLLARPQDFTAVAETCIIEDYQQNPEFFIKPGDVVLDVGAHIGSFSVYAASRGAIVYAFEPDPENFSLLQKNIIFNNYQNRVHSYNKGLYTYTGKVKFQTGGKNSGGGSVASTGDASIEVMSMNDFITENKIARIDLIKMDIEGAEYEIFKGLSDQEFGLIQKVVGEYHLSLNNNLSFKTLAALFKPHFVYIKRYSPYYFYAKK